MGKEIKPNDWDDYQSSDDAEQLENKERGCGYLKEDHAYVRADIGGSPNGILPVFVAFTDPETGELDPIPYLETPPRGYELITGTDFLAAVQEVRDLTPLDYDTEGVKQDLVNMGLYDHVDHVPDDEIDRHMDRVRHKGVDGNHWGEITVANQQDLLMRAGKSYYDSAEEFVDEVCNLGLNKGIPVHQSKEPPTVHRGVTRCFIIYNGEGEDAKSGVVGYSYLTRVVYTKRADGEVPKYAQDYAAAGKMDVVEVGEPESADDWREDDDEEERDTSNIHDITQWFEDTPDERAVKIGIGYDPDTHGSASELPKADLGELAEREEVLAAGAEGDADALFHPDGSIMAVVEQNGGYARIPASNNCSSIDPVPLNVDMGIKAQLGPYSVTVTGMDRGLEPSEDGNPVVERKVVIEG